MAELAAVGVAASILQVIDFGTRFVATAWELSQSEQAFLSCLEDLRKTSKHFRDAQRTLQSTRPGPNTAIDSLIQKSIAISEEMSNSLDKIGRGRSALKKAWLAMWKEEKLKALQVRLREVQLDLSFHITVDLRSAVRESAEKQDQILQELRKSGSNNPKEKATNADDSALSYGASIVEYLTDGLQLHEKIKSELIGDLVTSIYGMEGEESNLFDASKIQLSDERRNKLEQLFISGLCYDTMQERELTIKDAHEGTFRWIFKKNDTTGFRNWLTSEETLYWITGKPGSGKSTLMRYLLQPISQNGGGKDESTTGSKSPEKAVLPHGRCEEHLKRWAGNDHKLTIVSFHFWAVGSELQSSQEGLFRTLLVQLLRAHPEVIPVVAPLRWESLCLFNLDPKSFSLIELGDMFERAITYISTRAKLAMFIDGLDEFEGDCYTLISLVQRCVAFPVKICISSRPWVEFEGAFGDCPRLKMEDLTHQDISNYVFAKFQADVQFKNLRRRQAHVAKELIESIVKKSSGVFLWVTIVVASLLAGIGAGDRVEDLQKRLDRLPAEIKDLYERILENIDSGYRKHTAQLLKLMMAFKTRPSPLLFWYADEIDFMGRTIKEDPTTITRQESLERVEDIRRRLNSRCKGLLEIHQNTTTTDQFSSHFGGTVDYLHKTVYEFVCSRKTQRRLRKYLRHPYDANLRIAAAYAALTKGAMNSTNRNTKKRDIADVRMSRRVEETPFVSNLLDCLDHASDTSPGSSTEIVRLVDHLTCVGRAMPSSIWLDVAYRRRPYTHYTATANTWADHLISLQHTSRLKSSDKILCLATSMSVAEYVKARANPGGQVIARSIESGRPRNGLAQLADRILEKWFGFNKISLISLVCLSHPNSAPILEHLLSKGAKPNMKISKIGGDLETKRLTPWEEILAEAFSYCVAYEEDDEKRVNVLKCVRQIIDAGAKITLKTIKTAGEHASVHIIEEEVYRCLKRMKTDPDAKFEVVVNDDRSSRYSYYTLTSSSTALVASISTGTAY
ncbi:vegetative incompatibility het-e-1 [Fusarium longipes]|uniref:Vegetative incompatibility het-e-1 n=1 Tax=Fusarium longipes TaxID=694270 RepID=A0A395SAE5_9HYPO|nr:vegetative incompatibility het-e-1 [Fusarium longipes]